MTLLLTCGTITFLNSKWELFSKTLNLNTVNSCSYDSLNFSKYKLFNNKVGGHVEFVKGLKVYKEELYILRTIK